MRLYSSLLARQWLPFSVDVSGGISVDVSVDVSVGVSVCRVNDVSGVSNVSIVVIVGVSDRVMVVVGVLIVLLVSARLW